MILKILKLVKKKKTKTLRVKVQAEEVWHIQTQILAPLRITCMIAQVSTAKSP